MANNPLGRAIDKSHSSISVDIFSAYSSSVNSFDYSLCSSSRQSTNRCIREHEAPYPLLSCYHTLPSSSSFRQTHYPDDSNEEICREKMVEVTELDHYPTLIESWGPNTKVKISQEDDLKLEEIIEFKQVEPTIDEEISYEFTYQDNFIQNTRQISRSRSESRKFRKIRKKRTKSRKQIGDDSSDVTDLNCDSMSIVSSYDYGSTRSLFDSQYVDYSEVSITDEETSPLVSITISNNFLSNQSKSFKTQKDRTALNIYDLDQSTINQNKDPDIMNETYTNDANMWAKKAPIPYYSLLSDQSSIVDNDVTDYTIDNQLNAMPDISDQVESPIVESYRETQSGTDNQIVYESNAITPMMLDDSNARNIQTNKLLTESRFSPVVNKFSNKNSSNTLQNQMIDKSEILCSRRFINEGIEIISDQRTINIDNNQKKTISSSILSNYNNTDELDKQNREDLPSLLKTNIHCRQSMLTQSPHQPLKLRHEMLSESIEFAKFDATNVNSQHIAYADVALNTAPYVFHKSATSVLEINLNAEKNLKKTLINATMHTNQEKTLGNMNELLPGENGRQLNVVKNKINEIDKLTTRMHQPNNSDNESMEHERTQKLYDSIPVNTKQHVLSTYITQPVQQCEKMNRSEQFTSQITIEQVHQEPSNEIFDCELKEANSISSLGSMQKNSKYVYLASSVPSVLHEECTKSAQKLERYPLESSFAVPSRVANTSNPKKRFQETLSIAIRVDQHKEDMQADVVKHRMSSQNYVRCSSNTSYPTMNNICTKSNTISMPSKSSLCAVNISLPQYSSMAVQYNSDIIETDDVLSLGNTSNNNIRTNRKANLNSEIFPVFFNPMATSAEELEMYKKQRTASYVSSCNNTWSSSDGDSGISFRSYLHADCDSSKLFQEAERSSRKEVVEQSSEIQNAASSILTHSFVPLTHFQLIETDGNDVELQAIETRPISTTTNEYSNEINIETSTEINAYEGTSLDLSTTNNIISDQNGEDELTMQIDSKLTDTQEIGLQQMYASKVEIEYGNTTVPVMTVLQSMPLVHRDQHDLASQDTVKSITMDSSLTAVVTKVEVPIQEVAVNESSIPLENSIHPEMILAVDTQTKTTDSTIESLNLSQETLLTNTFIETAALSTIIDTSDQDSTSFKEKLDDNFAETVSQFQQDSQRNAVIKEQSIDQISTASENYSPHSNDSQGQILGKQFDDKSMNSRNIVDEPNYMEESTNVNETNSSLIEIPLIVSICSNMYKNQCFKDCEQQSNDESMIWFDPMPISSSEIENIDDADTKISLLSSTKENISTFDVLKNDQPSKDALEKVDDESSIKINQQYPLIVYVRDQFIWAASSLLGLFINTLTTIQRIIDYERETVSSGESTNVDSLLTLNTIEIEQTGNEQLIVQYDTAMNARQEQSLRSVNGLVDDESMINQSLCDIIMTKGSAASQPSSSNIQKSVCSLSNSNYRMQSQQYAFIDNADVDRILANDCASIIKTLFIQPIESEKQEQTDEKLTDNSSIIQIVPIEKRNFTTRVYCQLS